LSVSWWLYVPLVLIVGVGNGFAWIMLPWWMALVIVVVCNFLIPSAITTMIRKYRAISEEKPE
jgi:membrane protein YdbS with pleckstrin-like domain